MSDASSNYNILFLGETQSGKSTLIETLKKYADPGYTIDRSKIGNTTFSCTTAVISSAIQTCLPSYFIAIATPAGPARVVHDEFINGDAEDYEDQLSDCKTYILQREELTRPKVTFNLIDTPGLNDTSTFDESNILTIFQALENITGLHLCVITVSNNPFTDGLQKSLKAYVDLLPDLKSHVVFVHTKVMYDKIHPSDIQFSRALAERIAILHNLLGRESAAHVLIDNDLDSSKTVSNCITQNKHRELLSLARRNQPVPVHAMMMNKTDKMRAVDAILINRCKDSIPTLHSAIAGDKDSIESRVASFGEKRMIELEKRHEESRSNLAAVDKDDVLVLLHEEMYESGLSNGDGVTLIYPGNTRADTPGFMHHVIDHVEVRYHNVKVLQESGGKGARFWAVRFRPTGRNGGTYHVKIYIQQRKNFTVAIEKYRTEMYTRRGHLENHKADLEDMKRRDVNSSKRKEVLQEQLALDQYVLGRVSAPQMHSRVLYEMIRDRVYSRDLFESADKVERFYLEKKAKLELLEKDVVMSGLDSSGSL